MTFSHKILNKLGKLVILRFRHHPQNKFFMARFMLINKHWSKLKEMMLQEKIYNKHELRMMVEGMFYQLRVGCPWRNLPSCCGRWNSAYKRANEWSKKEKWLLLFKIWTANRILNRNLLMVAVSKLINTAQAQRMLTRRRPVKVALEVRQEFIWPSTVTTYRSP